MAQNVAHFEYNGKLGWGLVSEEFIQPFPESWGSTTAEIIAHKAEIRALAASPGKAWGESIALESVNLLSPITTPCRIYCQGMNYRSHLESANVSTKDRGFNTFFTKSSASVTGPRGSIVRPAHVQLLDYELELGLVIGREVRSEQTVSEQGLSDVVAGLVIGNDVSARCVQLTQVQFFKGKSYRSFCPLGPYLCLLDADEYHYIDKLDLHLRVNGATRQSDTTANMIFKPAETLTELTQFADLHVGDVVLTGTPGGCAVKAPTNKALLLAAKLMPEAMKWRVFVKKQLAIEEYLRHGDVVRASIVSKDRRIDLGEQIHQVMA
ncbi:MAG: fumarylacetoacetate hydrolase family protein [Myxococcales bacterium]